MCNYSQYIEDRGFNRGIEQGFNRGIEQGMEQGFNRGIEQGMEQGFNRGIEQGNEKMLNAIKNAMNVTHWTLSETMNVLQIPEADRPKYIARLEQENLSNK